MSDRILFNPFDRKGNGENEASSFINIPDKVKIIFKKLTKRDQTTRIKGLEELELWLGSCSHEDFTLISLQFATIFNECSVNSERQIRLLTFQCLLKIVEKDKKLLSPISKSIFPAWLGELDDDVSSISSLANYSFNHCFGGHDKKGKIAQISIDSVFDRFFLSLEFINKRLSCPKNEKQVDNDDFSKLLNTMRGAKYIISNAPQSTLDEKQDKLDECIGLLFLIIAQNVSDAIKDNIYGFLIFLSEKNICSELLSEKMKDFLKNLFKDASNRKLCPKVFTLLSWLPLDNKILQTEVENNIMKLENIWEPFLLAKFICKLDGAKETVNTLLVCLTNDCIEDDGKVQTLARKMVQTVNKSSLISFLLHALSLENTQDYTDVSIDFLMKLLRNDRLYRHVPLLLEGKHCQVFSITLSKLFLEPLYKFKFEILAKLPSGKLTDSLTRSIKKGFLEKLSSTETYELLSMPPFPCSNSDWYLSFMYPFLFEFGDWKLLERILLRHHSEHESVCKDFLKYALSHKESRDKDRYDFELQILRWAWSKGYIENNFKIPNDLAISTLLFDSILKEGADDPTSKQQSISLLLFILNRKSDSIDLFWTDKCFFSTANNCERSNIFSNFFDIILQEKEAIVSIFIDAYKRYCDLEIRSNHNVHNLKFFIEYAQLLFKVITLKNGLHKDDMDEYIKTFLIMCDRALLSETDIDLSRILSNYGLKKDEMWRWLESICSPWIRRKEFDINIIASCNFGQLSILGELLKDNRVDWRLLDKVIRQVEDEGEESFDIDVLAFIDSELDDKALVLCAGRPLLIECELFDDGVPKHSRYMDRLLLADASYTIDQIYQIIARISFEGVSLYGLVRFLLTSIHENINIKSVFWKSHQNNLFDPIFKNLIIESAVDGREISDYQILSSIAELAFFAHRNHHINTPDRNQIQTTIFNLATRVNLNNILIEKATNSLCKLLIQMPFLEKEKKKIDLSQTFLKIINNPQSLALQLVFRDVFCRHLDDHLLKVSHHIHKSQSNLEDDGLANILLPNSAMEEAIKGYSSENDDVLWTILITIDCVLVMIEGILDDGDMVVAVWCRWLERMGIVDILFSIYDSAMHRDTFDSENAINEITLVDWQDIDKFYQNISYKTISGHLLYRLSKIEPSLFDTYTADEHPLIKSLSPILIERQLNKLKSLGSNADLTVSVAQSSTLCLVNLKYQVEEHQISLSIKIPPMFPFAPATIQDHHRLGISEQKWRTCLLSIQSMLTQRQTLPSVIATWKANVAKVMEGIEPCSICWSVVQGGERALPGPKCSTCKNKFHAACLYRWFKSSSGATCPMCRSLF